MSSDSKPTDIASESRLLSLKLEGSGSSARVIASDKDNSHPAFEGPPDEAAAKQIAGILRSEARFREISIDSNEETTGEDFNGFLSSLFGALSGRSLDSVSLTLPESPLVAVCQAVQKHGDITSLVLPIKLSLVGTRALAELLAKQLPLLTNLTVGPLDGDTARILGDALRTCKTLQSLDLSHADLNPDSSKAIGEGLRANESLRSIDLSRNQLGPGGAEKLAQALLTNPTLESLKLNDCNLGDAGIRHLARALQRNTAVKTLRLENNGITSSGGSAEIAAMLAENTVLISLNVSGNKLGDTGVESLAQGLAGNSTLAHLHLKNVGCGNMGAQALAVVLPHTGLSILDLSGNQIGDEGGVELGNALPEAENLQKLDLSDNRLGEEGKGMLLETSAFTTAELEI